MRRLNNAILLLALAAALLCNAAFGQVVDPLRPLRPVTPTFDNLTLKNLNGNIYAVGFGVKADGVTSDSLAVNAALAACKTLNAKLVFPPGKILLDGAGGAPGLLDSCAVEADPGTQFLLTSLTVKPFIIHQDWSWTGGSFYWPNQTGAGAKFTATGSGTNLTVTGVVALNGGTIQPGYQLAGTGVPISTSIVSQTSGTTGGAGVYVTSNATTSVGAALSVSRPATVYPPLMGDDGIIGPAHFVISNVNIINAYDGIVGTPALGWGDFYIGNSNLYAVHDMIAPGAIGDSFHMGPTHFTPGPWLALTSFSDSTTAALNWASQHNTIFHAQGSVFQFMASQLSAEAWRYGIRIDPGTKMSQSILQIAGDSVGTLVEAPSGAILAGFNNYITGSNGCNIVDWVNAPQYGAPTCFNLGDPGSTLYLADFVAGSRGNVIKANGGNIKLNGVSLVAGSNSDGNDYYAVNMTANGGSLVVQNSNISGVACVTSALGCLHAHGINTGAFSATFTAIQNNLFSYLQDLITITPSPPNGSTIVSGNQSFGTNAAVGVTFAGTGPVTWGTNVFDKPPLATVSACGAGATISGTTSGLIQVGSTAAQTTCTLTLPFSTPLNAACFWSPNGFAGTINSSVSGRVAVAGSTASMTNGAIFYNCPGLN